MKLNGGKNEMLGEALKDNEKIPADFRKEDCVPTKADFEAVLRRMELAALDYRYQNGDQGAKAELDAMPSEAASELILSSPYSAAHLTGGMPALQIRRMLVAAYLG